MSEHKIRPYRPKLRLKKPTMYLKTNRKCGRCGSNKTCDKIINRVQWHREIDENGKWTGKWLCSICYNKEYYKKRNHENDLAREKIIKMREKIIKMKRI